MKDDLSELQALADAQARLESSLNNVKGQIAERIKVARKDRKITQSELAEHLHVSATAIVYHENLRVNLTSERLIQIIEFLDAEDRSRSAFKQ